MRGSDQWEAAIDHRCPLNTYKFELYLVERDDFLKSKSPHVKIDKDDLENARVANAVAILCVLAYMAKLVFK